MEQKTEASQAVDERAEFEQWAKRRGHDIVSRLETGGKFYNSSFTTHLWDAWQARAALKAQPAPTVAPGAAQHAIHNLKEYRAGRMPFPGEAIGILEAAMQPAPTETCIPDVLFDGMAVYSEIVRVKGRVYCGTTQVVSDTLDAVVRLLRSAPTEAAQGNASNNSSSSQLSGNSGELAPSFAILSLIAQLEALTRKTVELQRVYDERGLQIVRLEIDSSRISKSTAAEGQWMGDAAFTIPAIPGTKEGA